MRGLMGKSSDVEGLRELVRQAWPEAIARWSSFLLLNDPVLDPTQASIAQIDLTTRCVSLNERLITDLGLKDCLPAMLAHEVGHHVSFPGTLQVQARLRLMERSLLPGPEYSLVNPFTDIMINERLGRSDLREQMIKIYRAGVQRTVSEHGEAGGQDTFFSFYLALYEALWELKEGEILGPLAGTLARRFPQYRAEAALLTQDLFVLGPNLYTQFLWFLSLSFRYLLPGMQQAQARKVAQGHGCQCGEPSASDWGQALTPTQAEREAIRRAIQRGWFAAKNSERLSRVLDVNERLSGLPGLGGADASKVPEIMAAYYRQQAERLLFQPPPQPRIGEAVLPSVLEEWSPADPVSEIDWLATLLQRGERLGPALPVKRLFEAEREGEDVRFLQARMEIYLDVSGSMPNPCLHLNPMTVAAQILTTATTRSGGKVRLALYSHTTIRHWEWSRSERELSGFLMHYIGGGTDFPFDVLEESTRELAGAQPIRVIISDHDFDVNVERNPRSMTLLRDAAVGSPGLILLKLGDEGEIAKTYRAIGMRVVAVTELDNYPRVARDLAWALFPEYRQ
jgi:hypothetical protein